MMDIDELLEEVMIYEILSGNMAVIKMTSKFFNSINLSHARYIKAEGFIGGIPFYIDEEISKDYMIHGIK